MRLALIAAVALAQTLTQKIDVSVVNVDVTVTAKDGTPIRGLTRDDFRVFEDGLEQPITNFYAVESGAAAPAPSAAEGSPPAGPAASAPPPVREERFRRKILVLIDSSHISKYRLDVAVSELG